MEALNVSQELPGLGLLVNHLEHVSLEMHGSTTSIFFDDLAHSAASAFQYPQTTLSAKIASVASAVASVSSIISRAPDVGGEKTAAELLRLRLRTQLEVRQVAMKLPLLQLYVKKALAGIYAARSELSGPSWDAIDSTLEKMNLFCATPAAAAPERRGDTFNSFLESVSSIAPTSTALHDSSSSVHAARSELAALSDTASLQRCTVDHLCLTRVERAVQGAVRELDANIEFHVELQSMLLRYDLAGSAHLQLIYARLSTAARCVLLAHLPSSIRCC